MKTDPEPKRRRRLPLWLPVTLAFIVLIAAWTTLIIIANKNPTEFISVDTASANAE